MKNFTSNFNDAVKKAVKKINSFIEPYGEVKAFNYYDFTNWCVDTYSNDTNFYPNIDDIGRIIRDLALEAYDSQYSVIKGSLTLAGMDMLD